MHPCLHPWTILFDAARAAILVFKYIRSDGCPVVPASHEREVVEGNAPGERQAMSEAWRGCSYAYLQYRNRHFCMYATFCRRRFLSSGAWGQANTAAFTRSIGVSKGKPWRLNTLSGSVLICRQKCGFQLVSEHENTPPCHIGNSRRGWSCTPTPCHGETPGPPPAPLLPPPPVSSHFRLPPSAQMGDITHCPAMRV